MSSLRTKVWRMAIAWPQCGQTKVGGAALGGVSAACALGGAAACAGATCNSSRAIARLVLRLPLASKP